MLQPFTVPVLEFTYTGRESPDDLKDDRGVTHVFQIDHDERVIWFAPDQSPSDHLRVIPLAISACWQECLATACSRWCSSHQIPIPVLQSTEA